MNDFGFSEMLIVGLLLLLFVGPERLPTVVRTLGRLYGRVRRAADDLRRALVLEADRMEEEDRLKELRRRRLEAERERQRMAEAEGSRAQPGPSSPPAPAADAGPVDPATPAPGFTQEEWDQMPAHVRDIVMRRRSTT